MPPNKQFKAEAVLDRVAQLKHLMKRDLLHTAFTTAATELGIGQPAIDHTRTVGTPEINQVSSKENDSNNGLICVLNRMSV